MSKPRNTDRHRKGYYKDYLRKWRAGLVGKKHVKKLELAADKQRDVNTTNGDGT